MAKTYRLISGDSHLQAPADIWAHRVPARYRDLAPKRIRLPDGGDAVVAMGGEIIWGGTGSYAGHTPEDYNPMAPISYDETPGAGGPEQRVKELDADGVDAELIFAGSPVAPRLGHNAPDPGAHSALLRAYNDFLGEDFCAYAPERLFGVGLLPRGTIDDKIAEMEHCKQIGLPAVNVNTYPSGKSCPTAEDDRFWAAAIDLDMPLTIHTAIAHIDSKPLFEYPRKVTGPLPPDDYVLHAARYYGWSRSGGVDAVQMVLSGLFDRFPDLRIYWAENAIGWVPFMYEQLDIEVEKSEHWVERLYGLPRLKRRPSEYLREHAYWGFYEDRVGIKLRDEIGVDRIMWGGDFPHYPTRWPESYKYLAMQLQGVPTEEVQRIVCQNMIDWLHLDATAADPPDFAVEAAARK